MNNDQIIQALRTGKHQQALTQLYKSFPTVSAFIVANGGTEQEAKDIFQEGLLILFKKSQEPNFQLTAAASTYIYSVCKYMWKDRLVVKNRKVSLTDSDHLLNAEQDVKDHDLMERKYEWVDRILAKLGEPCKALLEGFYYAKMSMEALAEKFGYRNVSTAKTQKYKCLERAKKMSAEFQTANIQKS